MKEKGFLYQSLLCYIESACFDSARLRGKILVMSRHFLFKKQLFKHSQKEGDFYIWVAKLSQHKNIYICNMSVI